MTTGWTKAISHEKLSAKGSAVVRQGGKQIALFRLADGAVRACNNRCPHEGYPLSEGDLAEEGGGCRLTCNWHNWKFDLESGATLIGGDALRVYPVRERAGRKGEDGADDDAEGDQQRAADCGSHDARTPPGRSCGANDRSVNRVP